MGLTEFIRKFYNGLILLGEFIVFGEFLSFGASYFGIFYPY